MTTTEICRDLREAAELIEKAAAEAGINGRSRPWNASEKLDRLQHEANFILQHVVRLIADGVFEESEEA